MLTYIENITNDISFLIFNTGSPYLILFSFFLGSIPFGLIISLLAGHGDIRNIGSGNIGATNVLRTGNKPLAALTLIMDLTKSFGALYLNKILITEILNPDIMALQYSLVCIAVVLGHMFSPWIRFKGGKGVATAAGILIFISWPCFLLSGLIWLLIAFSSKKSSLGALSASVSAPIFLWSLKQINELNVFYETPKIFTPEIIAISIIMVLIWLKHHSNIKRIISRKEPEI